MSKKHKKSLKQMLKQEQKELEAEERRIQKKRRALMAACSHTEGKHFTVEFEKKGMARCRTCGSRFSVRTINIEDLRNATNLVNSALQQVRMLADEREEGTIISELGKLAADVVSVNEIYKRHLDRYGKNGKNKGKNHDKGNGNDSSQYGGYNGIVGVMEASGFYGDKKKK